MPRRRFAQIHMLNVFDHPIRDDYRASTVWPVLGKRARHTKRGEYSITTRYGHIDEPLVMVIKRAREWWECIDCNVYGGLVVSERVKALFHDVPPTQVEFFPIRIEARRCPRPVPAYFYMNFCRAVDATNLSASCAQFAYSPDPEMLMCPTVCVRREWTSREERIDPDRVPPGVVAFQTKYLYSNIVASPLLERLEGAKLKGITLDELPQRREDDARRRAYLAGMQAKFRALKLPKPPPPIESVGEAEKKLGFKIPKAIAKLYDDRFGPDFRGLQFHDLSDLVNETREAAVSNEWAWPPDLLFIASDGRGGSFVIDRKRGPGGPVFYCDHELATEDKATGRMVPSIEIADKSLENWLKRLKYGSAGLPRR